MANLRAGLVRLGVMGRHHLRLLNSLEGVDFVGVSDPGLPIDTPDVATFSSLEALIGAGVDYCVVAVPTALHEQVGLQLADAGVHALIEKPLAFESGAAERLAHAFSSRGLIGAVGHVERYNPALQSARARIARGDLGGVYQVATRRQGPFPARIADVGVVKDLATHDIDLTSWVVQAPYISVFAQTAHRSGRGKEDLVSATGMLEDGTIASHLVNWVSPFKQRATVITGERGAFVVDTLREDRALHSNAADDHLWEGLANMHGARVGDVTHFAFPKPEPLVVEHEVFRDAVLGQTGQIVTLAEGAATVEVVESVLGAAT